MSAWDDYLAAARRLDAVRHEAASVVAEHAAAVKAARDELAGVRYRAALQRSRLMRAATLAGVPEPLATPTGADVAAALNVLVRRPRDVCAAVARSAASLAAADAELSTVERRGAARLGRISRWPVPLRNVLVYAGFALLAVLAPLVTVHASTSRLLLVSTIGCGAVLPLVGYALAWLTVGMLYRPEYTGKLRRTPVLGAATTVATVVLLYTLYFALVLAHAV